MTKDYRGRARLLHQAIRRALLIEWDPIGVGQMPEAQDEYDSYVPQIYKMLITERPKHERDLPMVPCYDRAMVAMRKPAPARMSVDEFLAWDSGDRSGRLWQLVDGEPTAMAPGSQNHGALQGEIGRLIAAFRGAVSTGGKYEVVDAAKQVVATAKVEAARVLVCRENHGSSRMPRDILAQSGNVHPQGRDISLRAWCA